LSDASRPPYLTVTNFYEHQYEHNGESYGWIKLRTNTMHDKKVRALSAGARLLWYDILQLAGYYMNAIPNDVGAIARECNRRPAYVARELKELQNTGLLRAAMRKPKRGKDEPRKVTGWRLVRGSHGASYQPDPRGTDRLPPSMRVTTGRTNR
jgi:hypothetical protein